ncbi:exonuclease domain-containing protein [Candidatus Parabeggiatoa sp. HSG14]|uniref:exonuclease domain-containing protein n=1 Tax=Candidatus Parabeggiatoa sp. HSG14 TaxID=3055593 RepID=UPI0025A840A7|nr:exonuclease domain-containing protein [Thiotrichales bacterium HSG14]
MNNTYLFYDLETTGLNKAFDQVLQFAAIRTDMTFNEIEPHNIMVKLRPDIIPSPKATITHRISIAQTMQGLCEFEAITKIHHLLNKPGTISIGYNTLSYDDEFLRFCFHRNLLSPYTHQYKGNCRRSDLLPITIMYYLYKKEILDNWPEIEGKPTMKLEHISRANKLAEGQAHNAMVDVKATVELARRLYKEPKMWDYLDGYFDKTLDTRRIEEIPVDFHSVACHNRIALMIDNKYGSDNQYQIPVLLIGNSIPYKNQTLWLRLDNPKLREIQLTDVPTKGSSSEEEKEFSKNSWVIRKKYGESGIILPPHERYWSYLSQERLAIVEENKEWLQSHTTLFHKIIQYHREFKYSKIPDLDIEAALYQRGFLSDKEQTLCRQFHTASLPEKMEIVSKFEDVEMRKLANRLLCRNYPDNLPLMLTKDFEDYLRRVNPKNEGDALINHKYEKRTIPVNALTEIAKIRKEDDLDSQQIELLDELENHIKE